MKKTVLVTGGGRSGKSSFAQAQVEALAQEKTFIATCPQIDGEMNDRIAKHIADRSGRGWTTLEEETNLSMAIAQSRGPILIDCLTLWINNLLFQSEQKGALLEESDMIEKSKELIEAIDAYSHSIYLVTNEVGMGVIPANQLSRRFVDCSGRCNQLMAQAVDEVVWMVSGIPQTIKRKEEDTK